MRLIPIAALVLAGCVQTPTLEESYARTQARCAALDDELVRAQVDAIAGGEEKVAEIRARRQQACEASRLAYLLLYGVPIPAPRPED